MYLWRNTANNAKKNLGESIKIVNSVHNNVGGILTRERFVLTITGIGWYIYQTTLPLTIVGMFQNTDL